MLSVIAGMCAGADSIDDLDVLRAGGMPILFNGICAPSTLGVLLREFSLGHAVLLEVVETVGDTMRVEPGAGALDGVAVGDSVERCHSPMMPAARVGDNSGLHENP